MPPDVVIKGAQREAFEAFTKCSKHFSTHDLVKEFLVAGIWLLNEGWIIPSFGPKGPEGLCHPQFDFTSFCGR